jgi:DNA-3-methyladenine glycosylase
LRNPDHPPLPARFFARSVLAVARDLLGKRLVRRMRGRSGAREELLIGRIVETEAYAGRLDPASHSFRGPTPRCATMFGPHGRLYVYFTYGAHFCVNVVGGSRRDAAAILLRAIEPEAGVARMRRLRLARTKPGATAAAIARGELDESLGRGPGNLAAAFGFDRAHDGCDLLGASDVWIAEGPPPRRVRWTPRIGLGSNPAAAWRWRCFDAESRATTRVPPSWPLAAAPTPPLGACPRIRPSTRARARSPADFAAGRSQDESSDRLLELIRSAAPPRPAAASPRAPRGTRPRRSRRG